MTPRRSPLNLPVWAQFAGLTCLVTAVSLGIGLSIRSLVAAEDRGQAVGLYRTATIPPAVKSSVAAAPIMPAGPVMLPPATVAPTRAAAPAAPAPTPPAATATSFDGRPLRKVRDIKLKVTAYSPDERSCGIWADGVTASGYSVWTNGMKLVAADTRLLPFGTILTVPGYNGGQPVQVLDRGGKIKGHRLDVLYPSHDIAVKWGVRDLNVTVWEYAD